MTQIVRIRLAVRGQVQGVGFRPYVYRLATRHQLAGAVGNDTHGAWIEVEGPAATIAAFENDLVAELPPLARITDLQRSDAQTHRRHPLSDRGFREWTIASVRTLPLMPPRAPTACASCTTPRTAATAMPLSIAPIAAPDIPLSATCPTTGHKQRWPCFGCATSVRRNTTHRAIAGFMPSPMPARSAARKFG